jgi:CAAX protease family protein
MTPKRTAAFELIVVLAVMGLVRLCLSLDIVKRWLPRLPVIEYAWVYFVMTIALFLWLRRGDRNRAASLGLKPFSPVWRILAIGVGGAVADVALDIVTGPIIRSVFGPTQLTRFATLQDNLPVFVVLVSAGLLFGGFGEELLYRGIITTRLRLLLGDGGAAVAGALLIQGILFGLGHKYQGVSGMISIAIGGVMYGLIFVAARSNIWASAVAHGLIDTLGFTLMYLGVMKT